MSDRERIAQVAQDKWATLSNSLTWLRGIERMSDLLKKIAKKSVILFLVCFIYDKKNWKMSELLICSFFGQKTSDSLGNQMSVFPALL